MCACDSDGDLTTISPAVASYKEIGFQKEALNSTPLVRYVVLEKDNEKGCSEITVGEIVARPRYEMCAYDMILQYIMLYDMILYDMI